LDEEKLKQYLRARRIELIAMAINQKEKNMKRKLSMSEDVFAGHLGIINREIRRVQKAAGITDEELFKLE